MPNQNIEYVQLYNQGNPVYPVVGKSSYSEWLGYEEITGEPPTENFVTPIESGGTNANNASEALTNLGLDSIFKVIEFQYAYTLSGGANTNFDTSFITYPDGYVPIAIASWSANNGNVATVSARPMQSNTWSFELHNMGSSTVNTTFQIWILCVQSRFVE